MDKIFKAMADRNRRLVLTLLKNSSELSVSEILRNFSITQATLSSHLAILRKASLVNVRQSKRTRYYSLNETVLESFIRQLNVFIGKTVQTESTDIVVRGKSISH